MAPDVDTDPWEDLTTFLNHLYEVFSDLNVTEMTRILFENADSDAEAGQDRGF